MEKKDTRNAAKMLSILSVVICTVVMIVFMQSQKQDVEFGLDYSTDSIETLEARYAQSQEPEDLVELLSTLCYYAVCQDDPDAPARIAFYGTELYDLAKAEQVDLETLGTEAHMLELLEWIQIYGATR